MTVLTKTDCPVIAPATEQQGDTAVKWSCKEKCRQDTQPAKRLAKGYRLFVLN